MARPRRVITYDDAVRSGVGLWLRTGTVCMDALAQRLAVSRATLYRVVPGRDRLIGDVVWRQAMVLMANARENAAGEGCDRLLSIMRQFGRDLIGAESFKWFLKQEPDTALRVLWTPAGNVHERFVELNSDLLSELVEAGEIMPPFSIQELAYVLARVFESVWYADLMAGRPPNLDLAETTARAVLYEVRPPSQM